MVAPLSAARRGEPLPGVPFSPEAVANAFVMLGLLPEARAEEILAECRSVLEAEGFRIGLLTGELSIRPGAHGFQDAQAAGIEGLTGIPLAVAAGPVPIPADGVDLTLIWAALTPGGIRLHLRATGQLDGGMPGPRSRPPRLPPDLPLTDKIQSGLVVTDNLGRQYQMRMVSGHGSGPSRPGQPPPRWDAEMLAEPGPRAAPAGGEEVRWLEFASASGLPARVAMPAPAPVAMGMTEPPWPTPAECYLAVLASVTSMSIGSDGGTPVELDTAQIAAAVADALLWTGALPPDSALLSGGGGRWQGPQVHLWHRRAWQRARDGEPARAGLAARLPLRQATAAIESVTGHEDLVSVQLYGHPWVSGEYWPMITPCFQVRAVDDTGTEHQGVPGSGGGSPEGNFEFWFWPPIAPAARQITVTVSTLWEAAWAQIDIPGRALLERPVPPSSHLDRFS
jgi:hypothetical protein